MAESKKVEPVFMNRDKYNRAVAYVRENGGDPVKDLDAIVERYEALGGRLDDGPVVEDAKGKPEGRKVASGGVRHSVASAIKLGKGEQNDSSTGELIEIDKKGKESSSKRKSSKK